MLRNQLGIKKIKVGHAGTLDPLATGIVVVCTGKATKKIDELMGHDKEYVATIKLGETTPSFDLETEPDATYPTEHIDHGMISDVIATKFVGDIDQIPPLFSAIKIDGKRAYEFARKGNTDVEIKSRRIHISNITIESFEMPFVTLRINCSKGTYIRSIARDLGVALQSGAHLTALERTAIGNTHIEQTITIDDFGKILEQEPKCEAQA